jgi:heme-degrading monooxygenase HmoA
MQRCAVASKPEGEKDVIKMHRGFSSRARTGDGFDGFNLIHGDEKGRRAVRRFRIRTKFGLSPKWESWSPRARRHRICG